jgi:hypothetical protein
MKWEKRFLAKTREIHAKIGFFNTLGAEKRCAMKRTFSEPRERQNPVIPKKNTYWPLGGLRHVNPKTHRGAVY